MSCAQEELLGQVDLRDQNTRVAEINAPSGDRCGVVSDPFLNAYVSTAGIEAYTPRSARAERGPPMAAPENSHVWLLCATLQAPLGLLSLSLSPAAVLLLEGPTCLDDGYSWIFQPVGISPPSPKQEASHLRRVWKHKYSDGNVFYNGCAPLYGDKRVQPLRLAGTQTLQPQGSGQL